MALFHLTDNVLVQDDSHDPATFNLTSWADLHGQAVADVTRISHVVNWFKGDKSAAEVQALAANSIRVAAEFTQNRRRSPRLLEVFRRRSICDKQSYSSSKPRLIACVAKDESAMIPSGFHASRPLLRTVLDIRKFNVARPLPILFDVLERGTEAAYNDGFLVFTNSDICLVPHFYGSIRLLLSLGIDCLIINRRIVGQLAAYGPRHELAMIESGSRHAGFDCFVFPAAWLRRFVYSDACVGAGWVMRSLIYNLVAQSKKLCILRDANLTYHFGNDEAWAHSKLQDYVAFNLDQAQSVLSRICREAHYRELLSAFCFVHPPDNQIWAAASV